MNPNENYRPDPPTDPLVQSVTEVIAAALHRQEPSEIENLLRSCSPAHGALCKVLKTLYSIAGIALDGPVEETLEGIRDLLIGLPEVYPVKYGVHMTADHLLNIAMINQVVARFTGGGPIH